MKRIDWLKNRVTQMGHPPHLYEKWHAEIEAITQKKPVPSEKQRRRRHRMTMAGFPDGVLPPGMVYAHGWVMTESESDWISHSIAAMGDARPGKETAAYYKLAHNLLKGLRASRELALA
jgi:hypothetical protein